MCPRYTDSCSILVRCQYLHTNANISEQGQNLPFWDSLALLITLVNQVLYVASLYSTSKHLEIERSTAIYLVERHDDVYSFATVFFFDHTHVLETMAIQKSMQ